MELVTALVGGMSQDNVVNGKRSPLELAAEGVKAATDKVTEVETRKTNVANTVETLFKSNSGTGKRLGDNARALTSSLPKNRELMDQLTSIIEHGPTSNTGWANRHVAHRESIRLLEKEIPQLERDLATLRNDRSIRDYGKDPAIQAEMQALERAIADAKRMANFISDVTNGRVTKDSKLPDWFKNAPRTAYLTMPFGKVRT
jgi:prophage DNA circulation protein